MARPTNMRSTTIQISLAALLAMASIGFSQETVEYERILPACSTPSKVLNDDSRVGLVRGLMQKPISQSAPPAPEPTPAQASSNLIPEELVVMPQQVFEGEPQLEDDSSFVIPAQSSVNPFTATPEVPESGIQYLDQQLHCYGRTPWYWNSHRKWSLRPRWGNTALKLKEIRPTLSPSQLWDWDPFVYASTVQMGPLVSGYDPRSVSTVVEGHKEIAILEAPRPKFEPMDSYPTTEYDSVKTKKFVETIILPSSTPTERPTLADESFGYDLPTPANSNEQQTGVLPSINLPSINESRTSSTTATGAGSNTNVIIHPPVVQPYKKNQYTFVVENRGSANLTDVRVQISVPESAKILAVLPEKSVVTDHKVLFPFDALHAGSKEQIHITAISKDGQPIKFASNLSLSSTQEFRVEHGNSASLKHLGTTRHASNRHAVVHESDRGRTVAASLESESARRPRFEREDIAKESYGNQVVPNPFFKNQQPTRYSVRPASTNPDSPSRNR